MEELIVSHFIIFITGIAIGMYITSQVESFINKNSNGKK